MLLAGVVAILTSVLLADVMPRYTPGLLRFEHALADVRTSALSDQLPSQHPHVAIVGITDQTLSEYKTRLPIDRALLARLVDAIDAAGAKVIGIDLLFFRTAPADNEDMLIAAVKRAKAKVVLAGGRRAAGLEPASRSTRQSGLSLPRPGDPPATSIWQPSGIGWCGSRRSQPLVQPTPRALLSSWWKLRASRPARRCGASPGCASRTTAPTRSLPSPPRRCWGPAEGGAGQGGPQRPQGEDCDPRRAVSDMDQHLTPMISRTNERMPGAVVHGHIVAETIDGRGIRHN